MQLKSAFITISKMQTDLIISTKTWKERLQRHEALVAPYTDAFLTRRSLHQKHPVYDFLFTYYTFSPLKLKQWVPSFEEKLEMNIKIRECYPWFESDLFSFDGNSLSQNTLKLHENILSLNSFIKNLCHNILKQPPRFNCFGLHEWAMVYKLPKEAIRHQDYLLRISHKELDDFVESQTICCSHYDAYRFFTKEAKPLNILNPLIKTRLTMEQGGCLHDNMDLYKWSYKLMPWIGSDFIAKAFLLAVEGRELDMRASPYDLKQEGFPPICIETEEGRKEYRKEQQNLAEKAQILRQELLSFCERLQSS